MRWQTIGSVHGVTVLLVAHTVTEQDADGTLIETIRIISARRATRSETLGKEVTDYTLDTLSPLSDAQRKHLERLARMPVDRIDTSDSLELTGAQLGETRRAEHRRPIKDHRPAGCGCARMAQRRWQRLSIAHECHSAAGYAERKRLSWNRRKGPFQTAFFRCPVPS